MEANIVEYKEEIQINQKDTIIHKEDNDSIFYQPFWDYIKANKIFIWPKITLSKDPQEINDYFKIELWWSWRPHSEITITLNWDTSYTFNSEYKDYEFISINSKDSKIKWGELKKINVGIFERADNGEVFINRSKEIELFYPEISNTHFLKDNEIIKFITLNQIVILNNDLNDKNKYEKWNIVTIKPLRLTKQGLWKNIAKISIENDEVPKTIYSNQISKLSLDNLIFGDKNKSVKLIMDDALIKVDEFTKYDYDLKNTYKGYDTKGQKGYYIPYNLKGEFFPTLNMTINSYFKDFKIIMPYLFEKAFLSVDNGIVSLSINEDTNEEWDNTKEKHNIFIGEDNFDTVINEDLSLEGLVNLEA